MFAGLDVMNRGWLAPCLLGLLLLAGSAWGQNETAAAGADGTADGEKAAVHGQVTDLLDSDGTALSAATVNGTGVGKGQSSASVTGEGGYEDKNNEKGALGSVAIGSVGDKTKSRGQTSIRIEKKEKKGGGFDWVHYLRTVGRGVARGKNQSSAEAQFGLSYQDIVKGAVKKVLAITGESIGAGDGDIKSRGETEHRALVTKDTTDVESMGSGTGLGKLSATAQGGANVTLEMDGVESKLAGNGRAEAIQNGRSGNSSGLATAEGFVTIKNGTKKTVGTAGGSVINEEDGISELTAVGNAADGEQSAQGALEVMTSGGAGTVLAEGSARGETFNVDCKVEKKHPCCKKPKGKHPDCSPVPGALGNVNNQIFMNGTDKSVKAKADLEMQTKDGTTIMGATNNINSTGNLPTVANSSTTLDQDKDGNTEIIANNRVRAKADKSKLAGIDISSSTGMDSDALKVTEITDAVAKASAQGGDSDASADTYTNVRSGMETSGGTGAQAESVNADGSGSEASVETSFANEKEPGDNVVISANGASIAMGDNTNVEISSRSDKLSDKGVAISEGVGSSVSTGGTAELSISSSAGKHRKLGGRVKRSVNYRTADGRLAYRLREEMRPAQPRLGRVGARSAVCIGRRCFFAVDSGPGKGPHLLNLGDIVRSIRGARVARIADVQAGGWDGRNLRPTPDVNLDELFLYVPVRPAPGRQ